MKPGRPTGPRSAASARAEVFVALGYSLSISQVADGHWTVSVDGAPVSGTFGSQVKAWEAGVRAAANQDQRRPT